MGRELKLFLVILIGIVILTGCKTVSGQRLDADKKANKIIDSKQEEVLGEKKDFSIERPSDILRRRLLLEQNLPHAGQASFGTDTLTKVDLWPEKDYPNTNISNKDQLPVNTENPLKLSMIQALQVGAQNSPEYQGKKEDVFRAALEMDLKLNDFGFIFSGKAESSYTNNKSGSGALGLAGAAQAGGTVKGYEHSGSLSLTKTLYNGIRLTTSLAVDLVKLLTQTGGSSTGIVGDASISIPLLRGSGRHIVMEPLTQAERNVVYAIYNFERFKKTFAVDIVSSYLEVLKQQDQVDNAEENYKNLMLSARRTRMLADAGRTTEIQVDRAKQDELRAKDRWIAALAGHERRVDNFKKTLGIPSDSSIVLDREELILLEEHLSHILPGVAVEEKLSTNGLEGKRGNDYKLIGLIKTDAGPLEMDEKSAIELGFKNRVDLRISEGRVFDAQRAVVVKADRLGAELTLFGSAELGESRSLSTAGLDNASLRTDKGIYMGLLKIDLPLERTAERNDYRNSLIDLEKTVREFQKKEDELKLQVRDTLRKMSEARESLRIQSQAVSVAEKRVKSTEMFLEAGRAELRDILDAQEALLNARNALTAAVVDYRVAELDFQRDTGLLKIDEKGLVQEYVPGGDVDGK